MPCSTSREHRPPFRQVDRRAGDVMLTLRGHTNTVQTLAYSPDGKTLASAGDDRTVCLWDLTTGAAHHVLRDHTDAVLTVAFSPDGRTLASGGYDKQMRL